VTLRDVLFVSEDFYVSADEAVYDASAAVYVGASHDYCVLDLCVSDGCVVAYASVRAYVCVGTYFAVIANNCGAADCCSTMDIRTLPYGYVV